MKTPPRFPLCNLQTSWLLLGWITLGGLILPLAPAIAQSTPSVDPLEEFRSNDSGSDPFSGTGSNQSQGLFNLIHRANMGSIMSSPEFSRQRRENIGQEALDFRTRQINLLQQNSSTAPASSDGVDELNP